MKLLAIGVLLVICASGPAAACIIEPPWVPRLPNETAEQHAERRAQAYGDRRAVWENNRQERYLEKASGAFLGKVLSSAVSSEGHDIATVKPVLAVKGTLPAQPVRLETYPLPGCNPFPAIDGEGALGKKGDLVFVFTGLETDLIHPRGIASVRTSRTILNERLVEALRNYGLEDTDE